MTAAARPNLKVVPLEYPNDNEYYSHREALAVTAAGLRDHGLRTANSFIGAFAIVGEDIGDSAIRQQLHDFFIGRSGVTMVTPSTTKLYCGASRRQFSGLPTARLLTETVTTSAVVNEPLATFMVRNLLAYRPNEMSLSEQESHAGALIRSMSQASVHIINCHDAAAATQPLLPVLAPDLQLSLAAVWSEYSQLSSH